MSEEKNAGIGFFEKYLTLWVVLCMVVGVLIGKFLPAVPDFLSQFEYAQVSIPIAILIWLMIYPMMMKVDFASIKNVGKNPKGLFVTWITNWLIKPFTIVGVLTEVPVMLMLVKIANNTRHWFPQNNWKVGIANE